MLLLIGLGSALIYLIALFRFPLLRIYSVPLQNLDKLTASAPGTGLAISACVLLLFAGYALGALALSGKHGHVRRVSLIVLLVPVVFAALLLFVYPTTSLDVYDYLFRGRMAVRYSANNFVRVPAEFATDPLIAAQPFRFVPWHRAVTAYGPLWEAMSYSAAWLAGERPGPVPSTVDPLLRQLLIAYKALGALGFFACGAAVWGSLDSKRRTLGLYLWLWNPLVLWESVAAAHNDAWMALAVVAAVWACSARWAARPVAAWQLAARSQASFLALTVGGLIKYLALIFGPLMLAASLRRLAGWRARGMLVGLAIVLCAGTVALAYAPFWQGQATFRNFSDRGTLFYATWLSAFQAGIGDLGLLSREVAQWIASSLATALLAGGVVWSAWRGWRAPEHIARHALWLLLWFLLICNPWFQPWYLLWAMALAAVQPERGRVVAAVVVFCLTATLSYVAGSFLLPAIGWKSDSAAWNLLLALLIYVPPLAILAAGWVGAQVPGKHAESAEALYS